MVSDLSKLVEVYGEDNVQHLDSNLYRVRFSTIKLANAGLIAENGKIVYGNPRWTKGPKGKLVARGIWGASGELQKVEIKKMEELRASIQQEGLENPLRVRPVEIDGKNLFEVINGERRHRSIADLRKNKLNVVDPFTREERPATEVYEWVHCRINLMDDETALQLSLRPNDTGEAIGDVASLEVVRTLRNCEKSDDEILQLTGKSVTWLKEADDLLALDDETFRALQNQEINRRVALKLAEIEDLELRKERLDGVRQKALEKWIAKKEKLQGAIEEKETALEIAKAEEVVADHDGDECGLEEIQEEIEELQETLEQQEQELEDLEDEGPTGKGTDYHEVSGDGKPLTPSKIEKQWYVPVMRIIDCEDCENEDEDHDHLSIQLEIDIEDVRLTRKILEAIINGRREGDTNKPYPIDRILQEHFADKMTR